MHGMINRAIERFVRDTYGRETWKTITQNAGLEFVEFEPMLSYEPALTDQVITATADTLQKDRTEVLEDIGTYLVSHSNVEAIRRLMRFTGVTFREFLHALDDLPDYARLAVPDLKLPTLELREHRLHFYSLTVCSCWSGALGFGHVVLGLLRAMADDYGALVLMEHKGARDQCEILEIQLADAAFAEGRSFDLNAGNVA